MRKLTWQDVGLDCIGAAEYAKKHGTLVCQPTDGEQIFVVEFSRCIQFLRVLSDRAGRIMSAYKADYKQF
jgi:hypothetical protein